MEKENGKSADNKVSIKKKSSPINVTSVSIFLAFLALLAIVVILGWNFFTVTMEEKKNETITSVIFLLIGAAVSYISSALTSYLSSDISERIEEITKDVSVAVKQDNLISGRRDDILRLLMNQRSLNGEIKRIRILAHESVTFAKFFKNYCEKNNSFQFMDLDILVHSPTIQDENDPRIADWVWLYDNKKIETLQIRNPDLNRSPFYGIVIEFTLPHSIGLIGFYRPPYTQDDSIIPFNTSYGVLNESSILGVINDYFEFYWGNAKTVTVTERFKIQTFV